ncbi:hypothetical protein FOCC_FOCC007462 [Frankliniella occidentalis]|nr:hypothetical protein FOCC_FOCC007462 [Frankliniella occidentalis]
MYTGVMQQSLPCGEYSWVDETAFDLENVSENDEYGFFWEVDTEYPAELHAAHREYPLAPEKLHITEDMLSPTQKRLLAAAGRELPKNDVNNLDPSHPMYDTSRKKVPLFIKDEYPNTPLHSFVGLRAKNYCFKFCEENGEDVKKCKGIQKSTVKKQIDYEDYKRCLFESREKVVTFSYLRDDGKQNMFTWEAQKSALFNFDSKRYLCGNGQDTVPYFYDGPPIE